MLFCRGLSIQQLEPRIFQRTFASRHFLLALGMILLSERKERDLHFMAGVVLRYTQEIVAKYILV